MPAASADNLNPPFCQLDQTGPGGQTPAPGAHPARPPGRHQQGRSHARTGRPVGGDHALGKCRVQLDSPALDGNGFRGIKPGGVRLNALL